MLAVAGRAVVSSTAGGTLRWDTQGARPDSTWAATGLAREAGLHVDDGQLPANGLGALVVDVDADGDRDLITNPSLLEVDIWLNDGSGRLTRLHPTPAGIGWRPLPAGPYVVATLPAQTAVAPDAPTGRIELIRAGPVEPTVAIIAPASLRLCTNDFSAQCSPRAPPRV